MCYSPDQKYLLDCFFRFVSVPSPVGYPVLMNPVLEEEAKRLGLSVTYDNRSNAYISLAGEDASKTVLVNAHLDTVGMIVTSIASDGSLAFRSIGSPNLCSAESENVTVHTRDGRTYTGLLLCKSHSIHAFDDTRTRERKDESMMVVLDERVSTKADTLALGIRVGDIISIDARPVLTEKGFLKSRYIDDKGAVACVFAVLKHLCDNSLRPKYNTVFQFTYYEENSGGVPVPDHVSEMIAIDIGLVAPGQEGTEYAVSICPKDFSTVYDYALTSHLVFLAEGGEIPFVTDVHYRYGSDVGVTLREGKNLRGALFGMAVLGSHGVERTHIESLDATARLLYAYLTEK